jgi:chromosome segregation ATPase
MLHIRIQMRRSATITGGGSSPAFAQMSAEVQEREAALTGQLASLEARAAAAAAERDAIRSRVLQLETELRQKDAALEETMAAAAASGGRDKQVGSCRLHEGPLAHIRSDRLVSCVV